MTKIVGIIGGMGPLSTIELLRKIYDLTPVEKEQQHLRILVDNRPQIPDRTEYILGKGTSPLPQLQESARLLEKWGADFIAIACNTAHLFYQDISRSIKIPVLHMIALLASYLENNIPEGSLLGLLTTTGALRTGLYHKFLERYQVVIPSETIQEKFVMEAIYGKDGVKKTKVNSKNISLIRHALEFLQKRNPKLIISGCTEVALIVQELNLNMRILDPMDILAREIVTRANS